MLSPPCRRDKYRHYNGKHTSSDLNHEKLFFIRLTMISRQMSVLVPRKHNTVKSDALQENIVPTHSKRMSLSLHTTRYQDHARQTTRKYSDQNANFSELIHHSVTFPRHETKPTRATFATSGLSVQRASRMEGAHTRPLVAKLTSS